MQTDFKLDVSDITYDFNCSVELFMVYRPLYSVLGVLPRGKLKAKIEYSVLKSIRSGVKSTVSAVILKSSKKYLIQEWNIIALNS